MRTLGLVAVALLLATACGKKKDKNQPAVVGGSGSAGSAGSGGSADEETATAVETDDGSGAGSAAPAKLKPTVDLALSGAVTAKLKGSAGTCACKGDSANITLRSSDFKISPSFDLNVLVTTEAEWSNPAIIINVKAPQRGSYGRNAARHGENEKMSVAKDCSAVTIEHAVLKGIASKGEIVLKGMITCAP